MITFIPNITIVAIVDMILTEEAVRIKSKRNYRGLPSLHNCSSSSLATTRDPSKRANQLTMSGLAWLSGHDCVSDKHEENPGFVFKH